MIDLSIREQNMSIWSGGVEDYRNLLVNSKRCLGNGMSDDCAPTFCTDLFLLTFSGAEKEDKAKPKTFMQFCLEP